MSDKLLLVAIFFGAYFAPWAVAMARNHHQRGAIAMLNFLLGWTVLGWIIAMVWAATATPGGRNARP